MVSGIDFRHEFASPRVSTVDNFNLQLQQLHNAAHKLWPVLSQLMAGDSHLTVENESCLKPISLTADNAEKRPLSAYDPLKTKVVLYLCLCVHCFCVI